MDPTLRLKQLSTAANDFKVDRNTPIRRYFRSGAEMLKMANVYCAEDNLESAYVLYVKFLTLFVEKIRKHPEFKGNPSDIATGTKVAMAKAEKIKAQLKVKFEKEHDVWLVQEAQRRQEAQKRLEAEAEFRRKQYQDDKEKKLAEQRDFEASIYHQRQIDKERNDKELEDALRESLVIDQPTPTPTIPDRTTKPISVFGSQLRRMSVPDMVMAKFLSAAQSNTDANVETCGILTGKLAGNRFSVSHVVVPKQKGTADSCNMFGEEEIWEFQDKHDLLTLGWIHTHPSQTAFLSSVDLHTQQPYQISLPEALAIVCAPKYNETGFFVLTPNYGLDFITNCRLDGFHPHPKEPPLFEDASHVDVEQHGNVQLVDLR